MFLHRVARHFNDAGWKVQLEPDLTIDGSSFQPDLLIQRHHTQQAVLVRGEQPPGPFELAKFAAECKKRKLKGVLVSPEDPAAVELCEQAGLDFIAAEGIGEVAVIGEAPPPPPLEILQGIPTPVPAEPGPVAVLMQRRRHIPWWRWAIVALIWAAAVAALAYDLWKFT